MKTQFDSVKSFLKYSQQVLGVAHIYEASKSTEMPASKADNRKVFNFYLWPGVQYSSFDRQVVENNSIRTLFVFLTTNPQFETILKNQTEMVSKMNQALGGRDSDFIVGWLTPNSEVDFFSVVSEWVQPVRIILFRDEASANSSIYDSGAHKILETISPLIDINDNTRKRTVWNDFKRLLAST